MPRTRKTKLTAEQIVQRRKSGASFVAIGLEAGVSRTRASQLLRKIAPHLRRRMKKPHQLRSQFTGVDLKPNVKEALRLHVQSAGVSMSAFISQAVEEKLKALGVSITSVPINRGEPLPFD